MKNIIYGFAIDCGEKKRIITINDNIFTIGCFKGTFEESKEAISKKYTRIEYRNSYIQKLEDCMNMSWLTDEIHEQLKDDVYSGVRVAVAKYSDKYHDQLKDDEDSDVRVAVAEYSDKYHDHLKDDKDWFVRLAVAEYSDKYHEYFKDDGDWFVRVAVAKYSDKNKKI